MASTKKKDPKPKKPKGTKRAVMNRDEKVEHFRQNMRCELTEDEKNDRSKRIAHQLSEKAIRIEAAKSATAHIKAEIKQIDADISRLAQEINDGATYREVECERKFQYRVGKVVEIRTDTGAQTFERAMTGAERQLDLPKEKPVPKKPEPKTDDEPQGPDGQTEAPPEGTPDVPETDDPPESGERGDGEEEQTAE